MRYDIRHHQSIKLLAALFITMGSLLTGCTADDTDDGTTAGNELQIVSTTRAGETTVTTGYSPVRLFLWSESESVKTGIFSYSEEQSQWKSGLQVTEGTAYAIYGYAPGNVGSAELGTSTSKGANLILRYLPAIGQTDVCVVVGVQQVETQGAAKDVKSGKFAFTGRANDHNFVNLLMDHVYASVKFQFKIDDDYYALRHIKLKKLELKTTTSAPTGRADVSIVANETNTNPISTLSWTMNTDTDLQMTIYEPASGATGIDLNTTLQDVGTTTYYIPQPAVTNGLTLVSTYDVYDRHDNLIRANETAENVLKTPLSGVYRGNMATVKLTVAPTYLYVLSDPDLDSPTFTVQ